MNFTFIPLKPKQKVIHEDDSIDTLTKRQKIHNKQTTRKPKWAKHMFHEVSNEQEERRKLAKHAALHYSKSSHNTTDIQKKRRYASPHNAWSLVQPKKRKHAKGELPPNTSSLTIQLKKLRTKHRKFWQQIEEFTKKVTPCSNYVNVMRCGSCGMQTADPMVQYHRLYLKDPRSLVLQYSDDQYLFFQSQKISKPVYNPMYSSLTGQPILPYQLQPLYESQHNFRKFHLVPELIEIDANDDESALVCSTCWEAISKNETPQNSIAARKEVMLCNHTIPTPPLQLKYKLVCKIPSQTTKKQCKSNFNSTYSDLYVAFSRLLNSKICKFILSKHLQNARAHLFPRPQIMSNVAHCTQIPSNHTDSHALVPFILKQTNAMNEDNNRDQSQSDKN